MPAPMFSAIWCSRWKLNSSSSRVAARLRRKSIRTRIRSCSSQRMDSFLGDGEVDRSGLAHDQVDGGGKTVPVGRFLFKLGAAGGGKRIELGLASGFALGPPGLDPTLLLEAVEGGVERALLDLEHFT